MGGERPEAVKESDKEAHPKGVTLSDIQETPTTAAKTLGKAEAPPAEQKAEAKSADKSAEAKAGDKSGEKLADKSAEAKAADKQLDPKTAEELKKGLDATKQMTRILDGDVPKLNKEGNLDGAKLAYEKAIEAAKKITPEQIELAKQELEKVKLEKKNEKDPEKLRQLAEKEADLFTMTRAKDCAIGNMALWYYRQGKTEEGTSKFLEAAGIDPKTAEAMKKMTPEDSKNLISKLDLSSPILADVNFMKQYERIRANHQDMPKALIDVHTAIRANLEQKSQSQELAQNANKDLVLSDDQFKDLATRASDPINQQNIDKYTQAIKEIAANPDKPLTDEQKQALKDGIASKDLKYQLARATGPFLEGKLGQVIPAEKRAKFDEGVSDVDKAFQQMATKGGTADNPALRPEDEAQLKVLNDSKATPEAKEAAKQALAKDYPDFATGLAKIEEAAGSKEGASNAFAIKMMQVKAEGALGDATGEMLKYRMAAAEVLQKSGDTAGAKDALGGGLNAIPTEMKDQLLAGSPDLAKMAVDLGVVKASDIKTDAAATTGDATGDQKATAFASKYPELAQKTDEELEKMVLDNQDKGAEGFQTTKKAYEELITRYSTPEFQDALRKDLGANVQMLESGKSADGKALTDQEKLQLHQANINSMAFMQKPAVLQMQYAQYLGRADIAQNAAMQEVSQAAIKSADTMPIDLIKKERAMLEKASGEASPNVKAYNEMLDGVDKGGVSGGSVMDNGINARVMQAAIYTRDAIDFDPKTGEAKLNPAKAQGETFKPELALNLLNDAIKKNQEIHGQGATNEGIKQMSGVMGIVDPEKTAKMLATYNRASASANANLYSIFTSVGAQAAGEILLPIISRGKLKPGMVHGLTAGLNLTATASMRHWMMHNQGQDESLGDTMANAAAITGGVLGARYVSKWAVSKMRPAGDVVENRLLSDMGLKPASTIDEMAGRLSAGKYIKDADEFKSAFAGKATLAEIRADAASLAKLRELAPGLTGTEAVGRMAAGTRAAEQMRLVEKLQGSGVKTVGDLEAKMAGRLDEYRAMVQDMKSLNLPAGTTVEDGLKALHTQNVGKWGSVNIQDKIAEFNNMGLRTPRMADVDNAGKVYSVMQKVRGTRAINTIDDLEKFAAQSTGKTEMQRLFPDLANKDAAASLADEAVSGAMIGNAKSSLATKGALQELAPTAAKDLEGISKAGMVKEWVWDNRAYQIGKLDLEKATPRQIDSYFARSNERAAALGGTVGLSIYKNTTILKDNYFQPIDEDSKLSFGQALLKANFGSQNARFDSPAELAKSIGFSNVVGGYFLGFGASSIMVGNPAKLAGKVALEKSLPKAGMSALTNTAIVYGTLSQVPDNDSENVAKIYRGLQAASDRPLTNADLGLGLGMGSTDTTSTPVKAVEKPVSKPKPVSDVTSGNTRPVQSEPSQGDQSADPYAVDPSGSW